MEHIHRYLKRSAYHCGCKGVSSSGATCAWILYLGGYQDVLLWRAQENLGMCVEIFDIIKTARVRRLYGQSHLKLIA